MIRNALAVALVSAAASLSLLAGPAIAVPRDPGLSTAVPAMPQLLRSAAGLSCDRVTATTARCSVDFRDARHGVDKFCTSVALRGLPGFRTCLEPRANYGNHVARDVPEYRVPSHGRPPTSFGCSAAVAHVEGVVSACALNIHRAHLDRFVLRVFLNGRWQYALAWWPEYDRVARVG